MVNAAAYTAVDKAETEHDIAQRINADAVGELGALLAKRGTPIHAVGAGVVTFAGRKGAYGNTVEITHGNGYKTRYAHAHEVKVSKGDIVQKGQAIATVGSTGRSTGPHLHLEVFRNGMAVNPARHIAMKQ